MWQEGLLIDDRPKLYQCLESSPGEAFIANSHHPTALAAVQWLDDHVTAQLLKSQHRFVEGLTDHGGGNSQPSGTEKCAGQVLVDRDFDGPRWVDNQRAGCAQAGQCVHAKDHPARENRAAWCAPTRLQRSLDRSRQSRFRDDRRPPGWQPVVRMTGKPGYDADPQLARDRENTSCREAQRTAMRMRRHGP